MLKIMFVDDEVNVLRGMRKSYDWDRMGFKIAGEARNGNTALALAKEVHPDVVITDICMSDKNGLELISELKAYDQGIEVIILSGYPDFHYAKASMENGAFAYLLKPIKNSEFFETLEKVKEKIFHARSKIPNLFLSHLLRLTMPSMEDIYDLEEEYGFQMPSGNFFVGIIQADSESAETENIICQKLYTFFLEELINQQRVLLCHKKHHPHLVIICFCNNKHMQAVFCAQFSAIKEKFTEQTGITAAFGVSSIFSDIVMIRDAYLQALFVISQKRNFAPGVTIYFNENSNELNERTLSDSCFISSQELQGILNGIQTLNRPLVDQSIKAYFSGLHILKRINWDIMKDAISELAIQMIRSAETNAKISEGIWEGRRPLPVTEIARMRLLSEMQEYVQGLADQIFNHAERTLQTSVSYSKPVRDIQSYIMLNYPLNIGVDTIAENLHMDKYYLMRIYKKETGFTINEFLTKYRMDIACELLKSGTFRVAEVSLNVGYQDQNYFCKVFKKQTGYLPSNYKRSVDEKDV